MNLTRYESEDECGFNMYEYSCGDWVKYSDVMALIATGTEYRVCQDIADRQRLGVAKYGTTVEQNPLTLKEWLTHAYEECLDQAVYLKRAIEELEK